MGVGPLPSPAAMGRVLVRSSAIGTPALRTQVFTKMANWTADHKMTGVGNALKRHYRKLLWEYERANQRDIAGDKCMLCHGGPEVRSRHAWRVCTVLVVARPGRAGQRGEGPACLVRLVGRSVVPHHRWTRPTHGSWIVEADARRWGVWFTCWEGGGAGPGRPCACSAVGGGVWGTVSGVGVQTGRDWVACSVCQRWQHIACDPRTDLAGLADYAAGGKPFHCVDCSKPKAEHSSAAMSPGGGTGGAAAQPRRPGGDAPPAGGDVQQQMAGAYQQQQFGGVAARGAPGQAPGGASPLMPHMPHQPQPLPPGMAPQQQLHSLQQQAAQYAAQPQMGGMQMPGGAPPQGMPPQMHGMHAQSLQGMQAGMPPPQQQQQYTVGMQHHHHQPPQ